MWCKEPTADHEFLKSSQGGGYSSNLCVTTAAAEHISCQTSCYCSSPASLLSGTVNYFSLGDSPSLIHSIPKGSATVAPLHRQCFQDRTAQESKATPFLKGTAVGVFPFT